MRGHRMARWTSVLVDLAQHALLIVAGFVMMVVGLGLGVTMIMLPVGLVIGLIGALLFVTGLLVRFRTV